MSEKKQVRKNPSPLVVKGVFYVTATFEDKQYVVSNGLSFLRFKKENDDINKGDYVEIHGPVYQKKEASHPIITGEAAVRKLTEAEVDEYKAKLTKATGKTADMLKKEKKTKTTKATEQKMPWE
jgi:hypothetical protein